MKESYISYFTAYFTLSLVNTFIILYLPLFLLEILKINRIELSIIQFLSYLSFLIGPLIGFIYDKFSTQKKKLIGFSSILLVFSFSFFIFDIYNLLYVGLFLAINFVSGLLIRAGMSRTLLENSHDNRFKKNIILISNLSASFGRIFPIILFNIIVINLHYIESWVLFFYSCWFISLPILLLVFFLKKSIPKEYLLETNPLNDSKTAKNLPFMLIFLANFLIWADKLIEFPYISWILTKFGENGLVAYSYSFFIFTYLNMLGWLIARKIPRIKNLKSNMSILIVIYSLLLYLLIHSDLVLFLIISAINQIITGILMSFFTEKNVDISRQSKNKTLRYEIIRGSYCLASLIFAPLGTLLSNFIAIEVLIVIVVFISLCAITPLYFVNKKFIL